ncbi:2-dihydroxy-3-keto-5-methylthiopentene dioxygenase [Exserohilum turcicum]
MGRMRTGNGGAEQLSISVPFGVHLLDRAPHCDNHSVSLATFDCPSPPPGHARLAEDALSLQGHHLPHAHEPRCCHQGGQSDSVHQEPIPNPGLPVSGLPLLPHVAHAPGHLHHVLHPRQQLHEPSAGVSEPAGRRRAPLPDGREALHYALSARRSRWGHGERASRAAHGRVDRRRILHASAARPVSPSLDAHGVSGTCMSDWPNKLPTFGHSSGRSSLPAFSNVPMDFDTPSQSLSPGAVIHNPTLALPATCDPPSESNPPKRAVWIVFGATGHIGRSLVRAILAHGDRCTAVGWTHENTMDQMDKWKSVSCLGLLCDVRVRDTVDWVIKKSIEHWGQVDIITNSTGYGVIAACEDQDDYDLRNQFTTNFLGTLHIIQLSLPHFRAQNSGRYLIFSSTAGSLGVPGLGPYCATKYAVEGLIESMLYEVDIFNIKATLVEPGHVRLDEPDDNMLLPMYTSAPGTGPPKPKRYGHFSVKPNPSEPYATLTSPAQHARRMVQWLNDRQPVSAVKSAELLWQLGHCSYPPLRLILGSYAVESIRDRMKSITEEIEDWKHLSFPVAVPPEDEEKKDEIKEEQD